MMPEKLTLLSTVHIFSENEKERCGTSQKENMDFAPKRSFVLFARSAFEIVGLCIENVP